MIILCDVGNLCVMYGLSVDMKTKLLFVLVFTPTL